MDERIERDKYRKAWELQDYRKFSPGEEVAKLFIEIARPGQGETLIDFGTGTGRGALYLWDYGLDVRMIDIADNCLDEYANDVIGDKLTVGCLWNPIKGKKAKYGYCTDVMEHIPLEHVGEVLDNILSKTKYAFFQICLKEDHFGQVIGEHLHLTVKPFLWWKAELEKRAEIIEARHMLENGVFYVRSR